MLMQRTKSFQIVLQDSSVNIHTLIIVIGSSTATTGIV